MPPSVDETLLPPILNDDLNDDLPGDRPSDLSLDEVGAVTVLGAMVAQRKRSVSAPVATELDDGVATQRRIRLDPKDDLFQKVR